MPGQQRYSQQREAIYRSVLEGEDHPSAEMVYSRLKPSMPKLSLGTVYRNLHQMAEEGRMIFATHGHHHNENQKPPLQPGDVLLYGHTHVPICHWSEGVLCLNPGSVSIPKEGSAHGYLMLEEGVFSWKDLDGTCYHRYDWRHQKGETFTAKPKQL